MSETGIPVKRGAQIPLHLILETGTTTRFVLAHVFYADDQTPVAGSPFSLVHQTMGRYFPDDPEAVPTMNGRDMIAHYLVFRDAGFLVSAAPDDLPAADYFADAQASAAGGGGGSPTIEGCVGPGGIAGQVSDEDADQVDSIDGQIGPSGIAGQVGQSAVDGQMGSEPIEGDIEP